MDASAKVNGIEFLPGIMVHGHQWQFVASPLEEGRARLYHEQDIGSTGSHLGIYRLAITLQCIKRWIEQTYWPAFKDTVLAAQLAV